VVVSLNNLRDTALEIATSKGFKDASFLECIALIHSELSEAVEDYRNGLLPKEYEYQPPNGTRGAVSISFVPGWKPCGIPSELADVIIRVLHLCGQEGIDIERAVTEKMAYNRTRPFKHGKKI
jgi:NTP pyrophosphatase (non-canonical NTP hydrolase)